jgi:DNA processing protein
MAWHALAAGAHPADRARRFEADAAVTDVAAVGEAYGRAGVSVLLRDTAGYPARLVGDRGQPAVLFARGDPIRVGRRPSVAVVGTRSATPYGRRVSAEIAADLSDAGVIVVSGLAKGIDGAAHAGVVHGSTLGAEPVAVVGTGLDVVYPRSQADLWTAVGEIGVIFSEAPLGTLPRPRVFPARNRIIAALSDVVVVIECHHRGGSLYTADAAARRGIPVGAVPGSVRSPASTGCNALLADGCFPVRDAGDVLTAVNLVRADPLASCGSHLGRNERFATPTAVDGVRTGSADGARSGAVVTASEEQRRVWEAVDDHPTSLETILLRTGLPIAAIAMACDELVTREALVAGAGWWARA